MQTKSYKKLTIIPGYKCNNHCKFCINRNLRDTETKDTAQTIRLMMEGISRGCNYAEFAGGENAIRPDFCQLVKCARDIGYERVSVATNGRMFSYMDFAKKAVDNGLTDIIFSIHGHNSKIHDSLTGVDGCFNQLLAGIENILKLFSGTKNIVATNTAIVKPNYKYLPQIGKFILKLFEIPNSEFIFADPSQGGVYDNFQQLMPSINECLPYVKECLSLCKKDFNKNIVENLINNWAVRYMPLCRLTEYYPFQISDAREDIVYSNVQHVTPQGLAKDYIKSRRLYNRSKTKKCLSCTMYDDCEGVWNKYLEEYGDEELIPIKDEKIKHLKLKFIKEFLLCN